MTFSADFMQQRMPMWATRTMSDVILGHYTFQLKVSDFNDYNNYICTSKVQKTHECLPRNAVLFFAIRAPVCQQRKLQTAAAPLKSILVSGFLTRCQVL